MTPTKNIIEIKDLTKQYGKARGVNNINLTVKSGEFFGFIGPNGAGKSTTIRSMLGLIAPTMGTVNLFGMDITKDKEKILSKIGYLPSEAMFYSGMRVKDIIKLSARLQKKDCSEEANLICEALQLDTTRKVEELSFGNRKKVAIVCALQHKPDLIILDEPTSGLDPLMQKEFFDLLKKRNEEGATVFLSSHILSEVQNNCARAAIIREGEIIACDYVSELSKTTAKKVSIKGTVDLSTLEGIKNVQNLNGTQTFLYNGSVHELIEVLHNGKVSDVTINEPDLEEIFMHYYEQ